MAKKKTRDADATKTQILKAAEQLFAEKGFAGTTLKEISEASGASGPLIVFHFKDKQGVYKAVKAAIAARHVQKEDQETPADDSFRAFIEEMFFSMFAFYRDNPTMVRLANWGRLEGDLEPWPGESEWHHTYYERILLAQERGEIRDDLTPFNILIMLSGMMHIWWEYHEHFFRDLGTTEQQEGVEADTLYFRQCLSFVLRGLSN